MPDKPPIPFEPWHHLELLYHACCADKSDDSVPEPYCVRTELVDALLV